MGILFKNDHLIIGSGLFGATVAYRARKEGKKVLVLEKRPHLGSACLNECRTGVDFFSTVCPETGRVYADCWRELADKLIYTGPIDEYFGFSLGRLDWRTVSFKTRIENTPNWQGNAVVNYTSYEKPYTRVIEHKHFEMFGQQVYDCPKTVVSEEYSTEYKPGMEPYYPVNDERNNALADAYRKLAAEEKDVLFGGRLAEYKYYDMAPVIEKGMGVEVEL